MVALGQGDGHKMQGVALYFKVFFNARKKKDNRAGEKWVHI